MGIGTQLVAGSAIALKFAKSTWMNPKLTNADATKGPLYSIPLEIENHQQTGGAEVSESLVILKDAKRQIADNVAPGSWSWELSGYIPGSPVELTNFYTPIVSKHTEIMRAWFKNGTILEYRDIDMAVYKRVVIKSLSITVQADCRNKQPFSMTLKEINVMEDTTKVSVDAIPTTGSILGTPIDAGSVLASVGTYTGALLATNAIDNIASNLKVKSTEVIQFPEMDLVDSFTFQAEIKAGSVEFKFKWLNDRWNCWVTLPGGKVRSAGVIPNTPNWSGYSDYSLTFNTSLADKIGHDDLLETEMVIKTWQ